MPHRIAIEFDNTRIEVDQPMNEAEARVWLFDQAILLTRREPRVSRPALEAMAATRPSLLN